MAPIVIRGGDLLVAACEPRATGMSPLREISGLSHASRNRPHRGHPARDRHWSLPPASALTSMAHPLVGDGDALPRVSANASDADRVASHAPLATPREYCDGLRRLGTWLDDWRTLRRPRSVLRRDH